MANTNPKEHSHRLKIIHLDTIPGLISFYRKKVGPGGTLESNLLELARQTRMRQQQLQGAGGGCEGEGESVPVTLRERSSELKPRVEEEDTTSHSTDPDGFLSKSQIEEFLENGVLVVENVLSEEELESSRQGLRETLHRHGIDTNNLRGTGHALRKLSSTNGSGGVLDLFYDKWKLDNVGLNPKLFHITTQLWEAAFYHNHGETETEFKWHPYGAFNCSRGYAYIDRIGFRIPTKLGEELGADLLEQEPPAEQNMNGTTKKVSGTSRSKKKKVVPIQRSLTPHLDCSPENLYSSSKEKWRPIQCFVSLTDNLEPNTGGFEAVKGFHRNFHNWAKDRPPTVVTKKIGNGMTKTITYPAPCIGEYTHIRPKEDADVMQRVCHVPGIKAGSAVFFDNRIPHANAYRHNGTEPRCVVYCSFLPDIPLNRQYVAKQLENWKQGRQPTDPWIETGKNQSLEVVTPTDDENLSEEEDGGTFQSSSWTPLQRRLLGIDPWED